MHEILVILKKDIRRLWWQIAAMLAICVIAGALHTRTAIAMPNGVEVSLDILPFVWACLIAQAIHQEALLGDREFWMTRPYRWPQLLAAKALFAALFVHVPSFLISGYILAAHGFNPLAALPRLLGQQLMLAAALTLPAMALATVLGNLTQFVIALPILLLTVSVWIDPGPRIPYGQIGAAVLAIAAASVVLLQYRSRRTALARVLLVSGGLAAGVLTAVGVLSPLVSFPPPEEVGTAPTIGASPGSRILMACDGVTSAPRVHLEIPVVTSGFPKAGQWGVTWLSVEVTVANGVRYGNPPRARAEPGRTVHYWAGGATRDVTGVFKVQDDVFPGWSLGPDGDLKALSLSVSRDAYDRLSNGKVTLAGRLDFRIYQAPPVRLRVGENREVPGVGRCFVQGRNNPQVYQLTVTCESTSADPMQARVALEYPSGDGARGSEERAMAGTQEQVIHSRYPGPFLLSPLRRGVAYFWIDPQHAQLVDQAVVQVQQVSAQGTAEVLLDGIELPDASRCHGR
jgi:hypothetical protein